MCESPRSVTREIVYVSSLGLSDPPSAALASLFLLSTCDDSRQVKESFQLLLGGRENIFVRPLDDLVPKSRTNNLGR